ncbi:MAG: hypothetical protein ACPGU6_00910 [Tenacibaculum sp.]
MLNSPFKNFSKTKENQFTIIFILLTILVIIPMLILDSYLTNDVCKNGIVSFQLAKDINFSKEIINSWSEVAKICAGISLGLDFLFLLIYPTLIAILIHKTSRLTRNKNIQNFGTSLIFGLILAALFDVIENIALIKLSLGNLKQLWSSLAYYFAVPKFIIILLAIVFILFNFVYLLFQKRV